MEGNSLVSIHHGATETGGRRIFLNTGAELCFSQPCVRDENRFLNADAHASLRFTENLECDLAIALAPSVIELLSPLH